VADIKSGGKSNYSTSIQGKYHQQTEKSNLNNVESTKNRLNGKHHHYHHSPGTIRASFGKHS